MSQQIAYPNLSRGKGQTLRPAIYAGCLPCGQGRYVADLKHANIWVETHWKRCKRSPEFGMSTSYRPSEPTGTPVAAMRVQP